MGPHVMRVTQHHGRPYPLAHTPYTASTNQPLTYSLVVDVVEIAEKGESSMGSNEENYYRYRFDRSRVGEHPHADW